MAGLLDKREIPLIDVLKEGTLVGTQPAINLIPGDNVSLDVADNEAAGRVDVTVTADIDTSGLVPSTRTVNGAALSSDITLSTADIADSGDRRYVTDVGLAVIDATSGTNTGDQDLSALVPNTREVNGKALSADVTLTTADIADSADKRYLSDAGLAVLGNTSGTNTGDQDLSGLVPKTTEINGKPLSANVTLTATDVGAGPSDFQPVAVSGNLYTGTQGFDQFGGDPAGNVLCAVPFWRSYDEAWSAIGVYVKDTPGSGKHIRLGVYENAPGNQGGNLLLDAGEIAITTTGFLSLPITLNTSANTLYWLVALCDNTNVGDDTDAIMLTGAVDSSLYGRADQLFGINESELSAGFGFSSRNATQSYGALPSTYPARDSSLDSSFNPMIFLKAT